MIFVTGDTHGDWRGRLNSEAFPEGKSLTKSDFVIICGDFGIWDDSRRERAALNWLDAQPFTTLVLDGNHENYDILDSLPLKEWNGGLVHFIRSSVIHLTRGQIFTLDGHTFFTFGGASSHDISAGILEPSAPDFWKVKKKLDADPYALYRINHISWWSRELPSEDEMATGLKNLKEHNNSVDYILTHSPYTSMLRIMDGGSSIYKPDFLTDYLQQIKQTVDYKQWIFGHMHVNRNFHTEQATCIYEQIVRLL